MGEKMKRVIILILILCISANASSQLKNTDVKLTTIIHSETEHVKGAKADSNSFTSLYSHLLLNYDFSEDIFLSLAGKYNGVLSENKYNSALYLQTKQNSDEINQAILSEVSLNYDNGFFALNLGRQDVNYDWLFGSIDGILAMFGSDEEYSLRLFWFSNYQHLQYNYYMKVEDINDNKGIYGAITKAGIKDVEFSFFNYYIEDLRNIAGGHINYLYKNSAYNLSYSSAKALSLALYDYDEEFLSASIELLINQHYFELGVSKTGENGLLAMLQMGNFMFGEFYLGNQVDRENAKNSFLKYIYANEKWRFELIGGTTKYDNTFVRIQNNMNSFEIDSYLKFNYSKNLSFDLGLMYMNVDERDPLQSDQTFMMFNVVYNYENY